MFRTVGSRQQEHVFLNHEDHNPHFHACESPSSHITRTVLLRPDVSKHEDERRRQNGT